MSRATKNDFSDRSDGILGEIVNRLGCSNSILQVTNIKLDQSYLWSELSHVLHCHVTVLIKPAYWRGAKLSAETTLPLSYYSTIFRNNGLVY